MNTKNTLALFFCASIVSACGGGGGNANLTPQSADGGASQPAIQKFSLSASIEGQSGPFEVIVNGVLIKINSADTHIHLAGDLESEYVYAAHVSRHPMAQICAFDKGAGTVNSDLLLKITCKTGDVAEYSFGSSQYGIIHPQFNTVITDDGSIWGATSSGGANKSGGLYKIDASGVARMVFSFPAPKTQSGDPRGGAVDLIKGPDGDIYGTSYAGGLFDAGTVFKIKRDDESVHVVHSFQTGVNAWYSPQSSLVFDKDKNLYTTLIGNNQPSLGVASLIKIDSEWNESGIHIFKETSDAGGFIATPTIDAGGDIYGINTGNGVGGSNSGYLYKISKNKGFSVLHNFGKTEGDGLQPRQLFIKNDILYGITMAGGVNGQGVIFRYSELNKIENVFSFGENNSPSNVTVGDDGNIFITTCSGGAYGKGSIMQLNEKLVVRTIYSFGQNSNGLTCPISNVVIDKQGQIYGVTMYGGIYGRGGFYSIKNQSDLYSAK